MTRRTTTCATCRIEHTCTQPLVSSFDSFITLHMAQGRSHWSFHPHSIHVRLSLSFSSTFYLSLFFYFLFLSFFLMSDGDSMTTKNLRDSANGTFVTLDESSHFTHHVLLSKPTQSKPNPICDRSGKLDSTEDVEDTERVFVDTMPPE